jgi:vancomycin resistance protein VanJ
MLKTLVSVCRLASVAVLSAIGVMPAGCDSRITRAGKPPSGPHFTVMTYNVNFGMPGADEAAEAILESDADIVCLQETTPAWRQYLTRKLGGKYPHSLYKDLGGAGGMAVLSKQPFRDVAYTRPQAGWFPSWIIQADTPLGPVQICNVHLRPPLTPRGSLSPAAYFNAPETHAREIAEAYEEMDSSRPRLVVGDFNENDFGGGIAWLAERGFKSALAQFDTSTKTWRGKAGLFTLSERLDHILHSSDLQAASAWVVEKGKSDHRPVVAIIERAK